LVGDKKKTRVVENSRGSRWKIPAWRLLRNNSAKTKRNGVKSTFVLLFFSSRQQQNIKWAKIQRK